MEPDRSLTDNVALRATILAMQSNMPIKKEKRLTREEELVTRQNTSFDVVRRRRSVVSAIAPTGVFAHSEPRVFSEGVARVSSVYSERRSSTTGIRKGSVSGEGGRRKSTTTAKRRRNSVAQTERRKSQIFRAAVLATKLPVNGAEFRLEPIQVAPEWYWMPEKDPPTETADDTLPLFWEILLNNKYDQVWRHSGDGPAGRLELAVLTTEAFDRESSVDLQGWKVSDPRLLEIFSRHAADIFHVSFRWCHTLQDARLLDLTAALPNLRSLDLSHCHLLGEETICAVIRSAKRLSSINLSHCLNVKDETVRTTVDYCHELEALDISFCKDVTDDALALLNDAPALLKLGICCLPTITDSALREVMQDCNNLKTISACGCDQLGAILEHSIPGGQVVTVSNVTSLDFSGCGAICDHSLHGIASGCDLLKDLRARDCPGVSDEGLSFLCENGVVFGEQLEGQSAGRLPLELLDISGCQSVTHRGVARVIRSYSHLRVFRYGRIKKLKLEAFERLLQNCTSLECCTPCTADLLPNSASALRKMVAGTGKSDEFGGVTLAELEELQHHQLAQMTLGTVPQFGARKCPCAAVLRVLFTELLHLNLSHVVHITDAVVSLIISHARRLIYLNLSNLPLLTNEAVLAVSSCCKALEVLLMSFPENGIPLFSSPLGDKKKNHRRSSVTAVGGGRRNSSVEAQGRRKSSVRKNSSVGRRGSTAAANQAMLTAITPSQRRNSSAMLPGDTAPPPSQPHRRSSVEVPLPGHAITDEAVVHLRRGCSKLRIIDLSGQQSVTGSGFVVPGPRLPNLLWLRLEHCPGFDTSFLLNIVSNCIFLRRLDFSGGKSISVAGLEEIVHVAGMRYPSVQDRWRNGVFLRSIAADARPDSCECVCTCELAESYVYSTLKPQVTGRSASRAALPTLSSTASTLRRARHARKSVDGEFTSGWRYTKDCGCYQDRVLRGNCVCVCGWKRHTLLPPWGSKAPSEEHSEEDSSGLLFAVEFSGEVALQRADLERQRVAREHMAAFVLTRLLVQEYKAYRGRIADWAATQVQRIVRGRLGRKMRRRLALLTRFTYTYVFCRKHAGLRTWRWFVKSLKEWEAYAAKEKADKNFKKAASNAKSAVIQSKLRVQRANAEARTEAKINSRSAVTATAMKEAPMRDRVPHCDRCSKRLSVLYCPKCRQHQCAHCSEGYHDHPHREYHRTLFEDIHLLPDPAVLLQWQTEAAAKSEKIFASLEATMMDIAAGRARNRAIHEELLMAVDKRNARMAKMAQELYESKISRASSAFSKLQLRYRAKVEVRKRRVEVRQHQLDMYSKTKDRSVINAVVVQSWWRAMFVRKQYVQTRDLVRSLVWKYEKYAASLQCVSIAANEWRRTKKYWVDLRVSTQRELYERSVRLRLRSQRYVEIEARHAQQDRDKWFDKFRELTRDEHATQEALHSVFNDPTGRQRRARRSSVAAPSVPVHSLLSARRQRRSSLSSAVAVAVASAKLVSKAHRAQEAARSLETRFTPLQLKARLRKLQHAKTIASHRLKVATEQHMEWRRQLEWQKTEELDSKALCSSFLENSDWIHSHWQRMQDIVEFVDPTAVNVVAQIEKAVAVEAKNAKIRERERLRGEKMSIPLSEDHEMLPIGEYVPKSDALKQQRKWLLEELARLLAKQKIVRAEEKQFHSGETGRLQTSLQTLKHRHQLLKDIVKSEHMEVQLQKELVDVQARMDDLDAATAGERLWLVQSGAATIPPETLPTHAVLLERLLRKERSALSKLKTELLEVCRADEAVRNPLVVHVETTLPGADVPEWQSFPKMWKDTRRLFNAKRWHRDYKARPWLFALQREMNIQSHLVVEADTLVEMKVSEMQRRRSAVSNAAMKQVADAAERGERLRKAREKKGMIAEIVERASAAPARGCLKGVWDGLSRKKRKNQLRKMEDWAVKKARIDSVDCLDGIAEIKFTIGKPEFDECLRENISARAARLPSFEMLDRDIATAGFDAQINVWVRRATEREAHIVEMELTSTFELSPFYRTPPSRYAGGAIRSYSHSAMMPGTSASLRYPGLSLRVVCEHCGTNEKKTEGEEKEAVTSRPILLDLKLVESRDEEVSCRIDGYKRMKPALNEFGLREGISLWALFVPVDDPTMSKKDVQKRLKELDSTRLQAMMMRLRTERHKNPRSKQLLRDMRALQRDVALVKAREELEGDAIGSAVDSLALEDNEVLGLVLQFEAIDADQDGEVSLDDVMECCKIPRTRLAVKILRSLDTSGDGMLDFEEFLRALEGLCLYTESELLDLAFRVLDVQEREMVDLATLRDALDMSESAEARKAFKMLMREAQLFQFKDLTLKQFRRFASGFPMFFEPVLETQRAVQRFFLGQKFWKRKRKLSRIANRNVLKRYNRMVGSSSAKGKGIWRMLSSCWKEYWMIEDIPQSELEMLDESTKEEEEEEDPYEVKQLAQRLNAETRLKARQADMAKKKAQTQQERQTRDKRLQESGQQDILDDQHALELEEELSDI